MGKYNNKEITVLGFTYKIFEAIPPDECEAGSIDYMKHEILINRDMCDSQKDLTVLHEVAHAYMYHVGLNKKLKDKDREMYAQMIAFFMLDYITSNGSFIKESNNV